MSPDIDGDPRFPKPGPSDGPIPIPVKLDESKIPWFWKLIKKFWGYPPCNPECKGEKGDPGPQGITGPPGSAGDVGNINIVFQYDNNTLKLIYVNSNATDPSGNQPIIRDGKTKETAYSSLKDAFKEIPKFLINKRIIIDCTNHYELFEADFDNYLINDDFALKFPTIIGEGNLYWHYDKADYLLNYMWQDSEVSIMADLKDAGKAAIILNDPLISFSTDPITRLTSVISTNAIWTENEFQGCFAEVYLNNDNLLIVAVISNTSDTILLALDSIDFEINSEIVFKKPSAEFKFREELSAGLYFDTCFCSIQLSGIKITSENNPNLTCHDPVIPLSIANSKNLYIEACILDGINLLGGNTESVEINSCIFDGDLNISSYSDLFPANDTKDINNVIIHAKKRRRFKFTAGTVAIHNSLLKELILEQQCSFGGGHLLIYTTGILKCTPLGHGQGVRQAHDDNRFDYANLSFRIRKCSIADPLESGIRYLGGTHSSVFQTRIINATVPIEISGTGVLNEEIVEFVP